MDAYDYAEPALFGLEEPICPYTGLRTFTEDEAIYFRGREAHVAKCLTLLAAKRFVMITGTSGDGKSSLVFAGLLPEVRAGFLRGRYSNWAVATFRPERSPLRNMARALATALRLEGSAAAVETELEQGFSALVQLYQASVLCPPTELSAGLPAAEQRQQQRQAANLLVIVDQFEEFFTNPENYSGEGPNTAAQTVVNLLLETTRLAQAENLPIYIVCTMRSDFVGQCAEFGGLIEQIGTSQYFVPRLLRHEFVEVIKEPALLSGNRISERLVQRLLYDLHFGQDQLPVLQHALRRIWLAANEGREEMDLIHYAMVGGLAADELPPADQARFGQWRAKLSEVQQEFLQAQPSLRNVLDAHANQLYYEAGRLYNQAFEPPLPPRTTELVIERTFRVLTRTDGHRVVRNRLTGAEITAILNDPALPWPVVCRVLRPFRQADATFVSPFLVEEGHDQEVLPPDAVLDITHESLIRNWNMLAEWAAQEAEDVRVAQDLLQQANRWETSGQDAGFLLPIGPYSYFAQWRTKKQLNANWLTYYALAGEQDRGVGQNQIIAQYSAQSRFLKASGRRLRLPLLVARYGIGRLGAAVLLPVLLVGLGWWGWQRRREQADYVAYSIIRERLRDLASPYVPLEDKATLVINADRLKNLVYVPWWQSQDATAYTFAHLLDTLHNDALALDIELAMYQQVDNAQYDVVEREHPWSRLLLLDLSRRLTQAGSLNVPPSGQSTLSIQQRELAVHTARVIMALTHYLTYAQLRQANSKAAAGSNKELLQSKQHLLASLRRYAEREVATTSGPAPNPINVGFCLRVLLGQGEFSPADLRFLAGIDPLTSGSAARQQFLRLFPRGGTIEANTGKTGHSGGYLTSAIVFAARHQPTQVAQCLDSLRQYTTEQIEKTDGGQALLPYLVKYGLLTDSTLYPLLAKCGRVSTSDSFSGIYAATVYSLLSVSPSLYAFAVSPDRSTMDVAEETDEASRPALVDPNYLNVDRVSFSVPAAVREKTWAALRQAIPAVASQQALFTGGTREMVVSPAADYPRQRLFLEAFLAKNRGIYLATIQHDSAAAAQAFTNFSGSLTALRRVCRPTDLVSSAIWNLGFVDNSSLINARTQVAQDPIRYLQLPIRPRTLSTGSYFTCAPNAFFRYQLRREAAQAVPDARLVQLLDSVTFVEAAYPDRSADTRDFSLQDIALTRDPTNAPNLAWMRAIQAVPLPLGEDRQQRNTFLYRVSAALQDSARLARLRPAREVLPFVRQLGQQPGFAQWPLRVLLSDLSAALARAGRTHEAWALAAALPAPMPTISAIRVGEQLMLTSNQRQPAPLDSFLRIYQQRLVRHPLAVANSSIALLYWRLGKEKDDRLYNSKQTVTELIREGRSSTQIDGAAQPYKGRSLADNSYQAYRDVPTYQSVRKRLTDFNTILTALAHLKTIRLGDGWKEYDEMMLTQPTDYDGPASN